jgi:hypothetical protein
MKCLEPGSKPSHPLVVDKITGLCRLATQEDIRGLELIVSNYKLMVEHCQMVIDRNNALNKILKDPYYGGELPKLDD